MSTLKETYERLRITDDMLEDLESDRKYNKDTGFCSATFLADDNKTSLLCEAGEGHQGDHNSLIKSSGNDITYYWPEVPDDHAGDDYLKRKYYEYSPTYWHFIDGGDKL